MSFPNVYFHRKVADNAAKSCEICYKPSSSVMVTPENKDFFYVCASHLKDKKFCSPIIDEAAVAAKKKKEMGAEVERVRKEYEEKQKKKKEEKEKEKEKAKEKDKDKKDEKEKDEKKSDDKKSGSEEPSPPEEEPRVFALQKAFYQLRIDKKRSAEAARRNRLRDQEIDHAIVTGVRRSHPTLGWWADMHYREKTSKARRTEERRIRLIVEGKHVHEVGEHVIPNGCKDVHDAWFWGFGHPVWIINHHRRGIDPRISFKAHEPCPMECMEHFSSVMHLILTVDAS
ncbi:hypothetical protein B7463_g10905, partial [Scytalidium lignicola]